MSELINNSQIRKEKLKKLILKLHEGEDQLSVRNELIQTLGQVPYGEVVEVEQQLIAEGLPTEEVVKLCDVHSAVLNGQIDLSGQMQIPEGHPVDVFQKENIEIRKVTEEIVNSIDEIGQKKEVSQSDILKLRALFNSLFDVDKHYLRKEYLLFPFLEKEGITGPPKVMWGKHDEIRELIKASIEVLKTDGIEKADFLTCAEMLLLPAAHQAEDMTVKEDEILFPMALDKLTDENWLDISRQSLEFGFCLYDPQVEWIPEGAQELSINEQQKKRK